MYSLASVSSFLRRELSLRDQENLEKRSLGSVGSQLKV